MAPTASAAMPQPTQYQISPSVTLSAPDSAVDTAALPNTNSSGKLMAQRCAVSELNPATVKAMWNLFRSYYADVSQEGFLADLNAKQFVILLRDSGDASLQGFSTIQVLRRTSAGKAYIAVYSGDTIISQAYWGQTALQAAFYTFLMGLKLKNAGTPIYWFLISKGYKTYLLLSRGCPDYWPRHDQPTPAGISAIIDQLATEKFGADWKPELGVLKFANPAGRLKEGVAPIEPKLLQVPDIRFFHEKNPGHAQGDELCCLARIDLKLGLFYVGKLGSKLARKQLTRFSSSLQALLNPIGLRTPNATVEAE